MPNEYDHYRETEELIAMLQNTQLQSYGDALQKAMDEGATGTEIFMALHWNLERLLSEKIRLDMIRAKAKRLSEELDKALQ